MAKVQTRRSVSMSKKAYERLTEYAQRNNLAKSAVVERLVRALTGEDMYTSSVLGSIAKGETQRIVLPTYGLDKPVGLENYGLDPQTVQHRRLISDRMF